MLKLSILCSIVFACILMSGLRLSDRNKETTYLLTYLLINSYARFTKELNDTKSMNSRTFLKVHFNGIFVSVRFITEITAKLFVVQMYWKMALQFT